jgi:hypothetical protein
LDQALNRRKGETARWRCTIARTPAKLSGRSALNLAEYLLIESRDPFQSNEVGYYYDPAHGLVEAGNKSLCC